uniref:Peptidase M50 domain-containing protein n=1 Tax=Fervidicoccus fontis TaxID=683846 RepID=A0A7J3ZKN7_9CREN
MVLWRVYSILDALNKRESVALSVAMTSIAIALFPKFGGYGIASVIVGFAIHELAHRRVARNVGCSSRFVLDPFGLTITLLSALLPLAFLAPGYVGVSCWGAVGRKAEARIAAAGPFSNLLLGFIGYAFYVLTNSSITYIFAVVNLWLAVFNLIPLGPLDGAKIARGNIKAWAVMFAASLVLLLTL